MIWRILVSILVVIIVALGGFYAWAWNGEIAPMSPSVSSFDPGIVAKGAKLAALGDCAGCHTQQGGKAFAGGLAIPTPFGTIYATNITPDVATGIGTYSEAAFRRALRSGVDRQGNHLYPAFPYTHYTKTSDSDIAALYAFMMTREPVRQENKPLALTPPLNWRIFAAAWQLLFLDRGPYRPDATKSPEWNRGAYLVASLGHCGDCHTPLNFLAAEKRGRAFDGGQVDGWIAPALNAASSAPMPWTPDQLYSYLRTGFASQHGAAAGPMQLVVNNLRGAPDADLRAIATYIASLSGSRTVGENTEKSQSALSFTPARSGETPAVTDVAVTTGAASDSPDGIAGGAPSGVAIYSGACANCHSPVGALPVSRPVSLALSSTVNARDPANVIRVVLDGIKPQPGERGPIMPAFAGTLTDRQIVALVSYVRSQFSRQPAWTNIAGALAKARKKPATETP
jgi:mono/diheme cytochrome c family protein